MNNELPKITELNIDDIAEHSVDYEYFFNLHFLPNIAAREIRYEIEQRFQRTFGKKETNKQTDLPVENEYFINTLVKFWEK